MAHGRASRSSAHLIHPPMVFGLLAIHLNMLRSCGTRSIWTLTLRSHIRLLNTIVTSRSIMKRQVAKLCGRRYGESGRHWRFAGMYMRVVVPKGFCGIWIARTSSSRRVLLDTGQIPALDLATGSKATLIYLLSHRLH